MKIFAGSRRKKEPLGGTFIGILLLCLLFLKSINFYSLINVGNFVIPLACATVAVPAVIYAFISVFSHRGANVVLVILYTLVSVIMGIDLVYYNYAGKLTSVGLLSLTGQLTAMSGTLEELTTIRQLIPIVDLPVLFVLAINRQILRKIREKKVSWLVHFVTSILLVAISVLPLVGFTLFGDFKLSYIENEFITYHVDDAYKTIFRIYDGAVDRDLYMAESQADNPYYGTAKGKNVFLIQVEALQDFVIGTKYEGKELTPNLNALIKNDSLYFENYYYQVGGGNTSDAEFIVNNSIYPQTGEATYLKYTANKFYGLPYLLKDNGYSKATVFHGYYEDYWNRDGAYPFQGFDDFISIEDMGNTETKGFIMGLADHLMFDEEIKVLKTYEEPFYAFTVTISSHHNYVVPQEYRFVDSGNTDPSLVTLYMQSISYFDMALGRFISGLKKAGLYENSIFVIYGDHYGITQAEEAYRTQISEITGEPYDMFERFQVPLIIHCPGEFESKTIDTVGSHVDVLPTLLCLLGIDNDKAVMFGHNLLDPDYEGISYQLTHLEIGSFITKDIFYEYTKGNINSKVFVKGGMLPNDDKYLPMIEAAQTAIRDSQALLEENKIVVK